MAIHIAMSRTAFFTFSVRLASMPLATSSRMAPYRVISIIASRESSALG
jgi:hypothetical protein